MCCGLLVVFSGTTHPSEYLGLAAVLTAKFFVSVSLRYSKVVIPDFSRHSEYGMS